MPAFVFVFVLIRVFTLVLIMCSTCKRNQSFGAKTLENPKKQNTQSFRALGNFAAQRSKTLVFLLFWDPPVFWHQNFGFLGTLHGFGQGLLQNAPNTMTGCENAGRSPQKRIRALGNLAIKTPKLCFLVSWDSPVFWHQNFGFLDPPWFWQRLPVKYSKFPGFGSIVAPKPRFSWDFTTVQTEGF